MDIIRIRIRDIILDGGPDSCDWILLLERESFSLLWLAVVRRRLSVDRSANGISWTGFSMTGFSVTGFGLESVRRTEFAYGETARASSLTHPCRLRGESF